MSPDPVDLERQADLEALRSERLERFRAVPLPMFPDPVPPTAVHDALAAARPADA